MRDYINKKYFHEDSVHKDLVITCENGLVIDNTMLHAESFEYSDSICSEEGLIFGSCESSKIKFRVQGVNAKLINKKLTVDMYLNHDKENPFRIGEFYVTDEKKSADRRYKDIEAFDFMYEILNRNVIEWYNEVEFPLSLKDFRKSFFDYFGIEEVETSLINDDIVIEKTIETDKLPGKDVVYAICEINGVFGHINEIGKFQYVQLKKYSECLYPAIDLYPSEELHPRTISVSNELLKSNYISSEFEDFQTKTIQKVQLRNTRDDIGGISGEDGNTYIIENNFLLYGKTTEELIDIGNKFLEIVGFISYVPVTYHAISDLSYECGDSIALHSNSGIVYSYILERNVKGIQVLNETVSSQGLYEYSENVNGLHYDIIQLKGKINELVRTNEMTYSYISDVESGLSTSIIQNADSITTEVKRAIEQEGSLSSRISQNESNITLEVKRAIEQEGTLSSRISQNATDISLEVKRAIEQEGSLSSRISQNATDISLRVTESKYNEDMIPVNSAVSYINLNKDSITSVVSTNGVSSKISQESGKITISSDRFSLESTNCTIASNGTITCDRLKATNADISGIITSSSGTIGGLTLTGSSLYSNNKSTVHSSNSGVFIGTSGIAVGTGGGTYDTFSVEPSGTIRIGYNSTVKMQGEFDFDSTFGKIKSGSSQIAYFTSNRLNFSSNISFDSGKKITIGGTNDAIVFDSNTKTSLVSPTIIIGKSSLQTIGFFGSTGSGKKTVSKLSTSSSTTGKQAGDKVNDLIDALKAYGLIG